MATVKSRSSRFHNTRFLTRNGAKALVQTIKNFWEKMGVDPDTLIFEVKMHAHGGEDFFSVKSNLVNGLPPGFKGSPHKKRLEFIPVVEVD